MFKKIMQFFLGAPVGHTSEADRFLQQVRAAQPVPSASQEKTVAEHAVIFAQRDGVVSVSKTLPADF